MNYSPRTLLRISYVAVGPLLIGLVGMSAAVLIGCAVGFAGAETSDTWQVLGVFEFPTRARPQVLGALFAAAFVGVLVYIMYLRAVGLALRKHGLRFVEFALKPLRERRSMVQSAKKKQRNGG